MVGPFRRLLGGALALAIVALYGAGAGATVGLHDRWGYGVICRDTGPYDTGAGAFIGMFWPLGLPGTVAYRMTAGPADPCPVPPGAVPSPLTPSDPLSPGAP